MSKNTYDALYSKTKGAANPVKKIRATKSDLIRWAGVSDVAIDKHLRHLKSVGLLKVDFMIGSHEGNWYEVFMPEEVNTLNQDSLTKQPDQRNKPNILNKVERADFFENEEIHNFAETSSIAVENINGALDDFAAAMSEVSRKLTKEGLREYEKGKWRELADLLVMELESAAARTDSISNVTAFLTEHLRRRLSQKPESILNENQTGKKGSG